MAHIMAHIIVADNVIRYYYVEMLIALFRFQWIPLVSSCCSNINCCFECPDDCQYCSGMLYALCIDLAIFKLYLFTVVNRLYHRLIAVSRRSFQMFNCEKRPPRTQFSVMY